MRAGPEVNGAAAPASSPARTRLRIIRAAQEVFGRSGYGGGRTLDVASIARVTERTVFRHFPTKAELFLAAAVEPFQTYIKTFVDEWEDREHGVLTVWDETRGFYAGLFDILDTYRGLVVALIATREFEDHAGDAFSNLDAAVAELLTAAESTLAIESAARGLAGVPAVNVRFMLMLAISAVVLGDWILSRHADPDREQMLDDVTRFTLYGLGARPEA
jgi:AcrR family transcriptional regulator